jgi:ketosteroid isomerase-like protein
VHVEGTAAWVNATGTVTLRGDAANDRTLPYRVTAVFVRRDGRWRWHTHHGSEPNRAG